MDFPAWPDDIDPGDVTSVLPHLGLDNFRHHSPMPTEQMASYSWCPYST